MYSDVVLVVCGAGEGLMTAILLTDVRPLPSVGTDVDLADVGRRERSVATLERTLERSFA